MERRFEDRDFEKLLKENANQYRMYPSEKVWEGVHLALHSRRKWYGISALAILLITGMGLSVFFIVNNSGKQSNAEIKKAISVSTSQFLTPGLLSEKSSPQVSVIYNEQFAKADKHILQLPDAYKEIAVQNNTAELPAKENQLSSIQAEQFIEQSVLVENNISEFQKLASNSTAIEVEKETSNSVTANLEEKINEDARLKMDISALSSLNAPIIFPEKQPKITAQMYFTPTISYRKLSENDTKGTYSYSQLVGVNNLVKHKPLIGLEFGIEGKYRVSEKFFLKSGFQFNINRYDINAYSHPTEIATVSVNSGFRRYNMSAPSNYGNFSGNKQNWIENFYFQVALPIGAELILTQKKKYSWGISGTVQPTYTVGDRAYLISSDFRNYAKFPDLMRRWNLSTGAETFISYTTGKITWQTGPHIRYQHLSSFKSSYPVKENLFAVGLKIGATLNYK